MTHQQPILSTSIQAPSVQATVWEYDPASYSGSAVTDDGVQWPFELDALEFSQIRLLRPGQRVWLHMDQPPGPHSQVVSVTLLTIGAAEG